MTETTMPTNEQIHEYATNFKSLSFDAATNEYFTIWGQYANPDLVGKRKVVTREQLVKQMQGFSRDMAIYSCD